MTVQSILKRASAQISFSKVTISNQFAHEILFLNSKEKIPNSLLSKKVLSYFYDKRNYNFIIRVHV